mgnify:CR=1 FL=1
MGAEGGFGRRWVVVSEARVPERERDERASSSRARALEAADAHVLADAVADARAHGITERHHGRRRDDADGRRL